MRSANLQQIDNDAFAFKVLAHVLGSSLVQVLRAVRFAMPPGSIEPEFVRLQQQEGNFLILGKTALKCAFVEDVRPDFAIAMYCACQEAINNMQDLHDQPAIMTKSHFNAQRAIGAAMEALFAFQYRQGYDSVLRQSVESVNYASQATGVSACLRQFADYVIELLKQQTTYVPSVAPAPVR